MPQTDEEFAQALANEGPRILRGIHRKELIDMITRHRRGLDNWQRFPDGRLKPFLTPYQYDQLRDDDRFLYNRGPKPEGLV